MAGLLDIAPASEQVMVRGTAVEVTGISVKGIASLLGRFPQLQQLIQGGQLEVDSLMELSGDMVAAIIAAGTGMPGHPVAEEKAASLGLEIQADLLEAIIRQTLPGGLGPFVARLERAGEGLGMMTSKQPEPASSPSTNPNGLAQPELSETSQLPLTS